jgi:galactose mutarotase-like enzyme
MKDTKTFLKAEFVLENMSQTHITGKREGDLAFVQGYFVKEDVLHYRSSVETESGIDMCVNMTVHKFHMLLNGIEEKEAEL